MVPIGTRLPKVCLRCGGRRDMTHRTGRYTLGGLGQSGGAVGGAAGAALAPLLRSLDRTLAVGVFATILVVVGGLAWIADQSARKLELELPLCRTCDAAWEEGLSIRKWVLAGMTGSVALLAAGYAMETTALLYAGGVAFGLVILGALAARLPARFVAATTVKPDSVSLKVRPDVADDVVARATRRAERRAAKDAEAEDA